MEKLILTPEKIFNTEFNHSAKGYDADQVDLLLDDVLSDYQTMEANLQEALDIITNLKSQIKSLQQEKIELEAKAKSFDLSSTTSYSSVDLLKRVSRLEELYYKK